MDDRIIHFIWPGSEFEKGFVITLLPLHEDFPGKRLWKAGTVSSVSVDNLGPDAMFRCSGKKQKTVVVKTFGRG